MPLLCEPGPSPGITAVVSSDWSVFAGRIAAIQAIGELDQMRPSIFTGQNLSGDYEPRW